MWLLYRCCRGDSTGQLKLQVRPLNSHSMPAWPARSRHPAVDSMHQGDLLIGASSHPLDIPDALWDRHLAAITAPEHTHAHSPLHDAASPRPADQQVDSAPVAAAEAFAGTEDLESDSEELVVSLQRSLEVLHGRFCKRLADMRLTWLTWAEHAQDGKRCLLNSMASWPWRLRQQHSRR